MGGPAGPFRLPVFLKGLFQPQKHHFKTKIPFSFWYNPLTSGHLAWSDPGTDDPGTGELMCGHLAWSEPGTDVVVLNHSPTVMDTLGTVIKVDHI